MQMQCKDKGRFTIKHPLSNKVIKKLSTYAFMRTGNPA